MVSRELLERKLCYHGDPIDAHSDDRRDLYSAFNGDYQFNAQQLKIANIKQDAHMGNHAHPDEHYEFFTLTSGSGDIYIEDEDGLVHKFALKPGSKIQIPPHYYHELDIKEGSTLIGMTATPYTTPDKIDFRREGPSVIETYQFQQQNLEEELRETSQQ